MAKDTMSVHPTLAKLRRRAAGALAELQRATLGQVKAIEGQIAQLQRSRKLLLDEMGQGRRSHGSARAACCGRDGVPSALPLGGREETPAHRSAAGSPVYSRSIALRLRSRARRRSLA